MSEEMNKELETEVIAGVTAEEPVETMEDFAAELEASYKTLNKRNIELSEEESGQGAKWAQFAQMMEDKTVVKVKIMRLSRAAWSHPWRKYAHHPGLPAVYRVCGETGRLAGQVCGVCDHHR